MIGVLGSDGTKTYPFLFMAKVLDTIIKTQPNAQLLFNYIPKQLEDAKAIYNLCNTETQKHIYLDVFGKSLRDFMSITHFCNALIGNEGGAINMAKALNIKTFTIFSPWIRKEVWSLFEDHINHVSVHLKDYKPNLFNNKSTKDLKATHLELYNAFEPLLFENQITQFLNNSFSRSS
jgi:heptosyltransferase-2